MGIINLPTYEAKEVEKPAPNQPNPSFQGLAALQNAQKNFYSTLFDGAVQLADSTITKIENDQYSAKMKQISDGDTTDLRNIEEKPITSRDPRMNDVPDSMKATPNLWLFQQQRQARIDTVMKDVQIPKVRQALQAWSDERAIAQKDSLARFDFAKAKEVRADNLTSDVSSAIEQGNFGQVDDLLQAATLDGTISEAKQNEYGDLARKDITKQNIQMHVAGMDELTGRQFLVNPENLKYRSRDGTDKEMPAADQASLLKWFTDDLTVRREMQTRADKVQTSTVDSQMGTALINLLEGKPGALTLDMIQSGQWPQVDSGEKKKEWETSLRSAMDSFKKPATDKENWNDSTGYLPLAAQVYAFDRKKDPVSAAALSNQIVKAGTVDHSITAAHMTSLLQGLQLDPDPIRSTLIHDAGTLLPTGKDDPAENTQRNASATADVERFLNSPKAQTMTPQQLQEGTQRILDFNKNQYITDKLNQWYGTTQTQGKILGVLGARNEPATAFATVMSELPKIDEAAAAGDKAAIATKKKIQTLAMDDFLKTGNKIASVNTSSAQIRIQDTKGIWWTPVYDPQTQQTTWKWLDAQAGRPGVWR
jgi:hypothetical protein